MRRPPRSARAGRFGGSPDHWHARWSARVPPIARIESGDRLDLEVRDASSGQLNAHSRALDLGRIDHDRVDAAVGPFAVAGARPGDALRVEIEEIVVGSWGWSGVFHDFGLLRHRFDDDLVIWRLRRGVARPDHGFLRPVDIPVHPMLGWLGTAPAQGEHPMIPPRRTGGNMDSRLHAPGTILVLPVEVSEGLLSVGDPHAAMGDGEVCGTGIETPARVRLRVEVVPGGAPPYPRAEVPHPPADTGPVWVTTGIDADPVEAARLAVESMIAWLQDRGLEPKEAYLLTSLVGHLRLSEVVDLPNYVVSMTFPSDLRWDDRASGTRFNARRSRESRTHHE